MSGRDTFAAVWFVVIGVTALILSAGQTNKTTKTVLVVIGIASLVASLVAALGGI